MDPKAASDLKEDKSAHSEKIRELEAILAKLRKKDQDALHHKNSIIDVWRDKDEQSQELIRKLTEEIKKSRSIQKSKACSIF